MKTCAGLDRELRSRSAVRRAAAAERAGALNCGDLTLALERSLNDRSAEVRMRAIEALGRLNAVNVKKVVRALSDPDELVRAQAAETLGLARGGVVVKALRMALRDQSPLVRGYAGAALGSLGEPRHRELLLRLASREASDEARLGLLTGLYLLGDRRVFRGFLKLLDSPDYRVRSATIKTVVAASTTLERSLTARVALRELLKREPTRAVKSTLREALKKLTGKNPQRVAQRKRDYLP